MNIMYQARNKKITNSLLCDGIFMSYGISANTYDASLPGHLKSGHDNVPPDVISLARTATFEVVDAAFQSNVVVMIKENKRESVVRAIKDVLREDTTILDHYVIGYVSGYEKSNILSSSTFSLSALLASVFRYAIVEVANQSCKVEIKEISSDYVAGFDTLNEPIYFESSIAEKQTPLKKTLHDPTFDRVFEKIPSVTVSGWANTSNVQIYGVDANNCKFKFRALKEFLVDNIGNYVFQE